ncbi:hypothetical protein RFZ51_12815, partial [Acinetobacter baumannii]|nr:hypothetical protein [Acinetobacter baumannii]
LQRDGRARKPIWRSCVNVPVIRIELDAKGAEPKDVHVDLAGAKIAPSGHRDLRAAETTEERTHDGG